MRLSALLLLLCAAIIGCVDQQKEVAVYRDVLDDRVPPATQQSVDGPLSFLDALRFANQNNENLAIGGETYLQALIAKKRAFAAFLPTVSLAPVYLVRDSSSGGSDANGSAPRDTQLDVPIVGTMNVFNGFSDVASFKAAAATVEQQRALLLNLRQSLLIDVARAYFQVLRSEQSVIVLTNSIAVQEERVADIRARMNVGFAKMLDMAQTEAQASATRVLLIDARNDVQRGRELLQLLVGVPIADRPLIETIEAPPAEMPVESFESMGLERREDLIASGIGIDAARRNVEGALGQYWPSVSVDVNYFLSRQSFPTEADWSGLLVANVPIFSAGIIEQNVRQAWSQLRQAKYADSFTRRQVIADVRTAYDDYAASGRRLSELQTQMAAAQEALAQADELFRAGLGTNLERIVAQDQYLSAQLQYTSERYDNRVFYLSLLRAAGALDDILMWNPTTMPTTEPIAEPTTEPATQD